MVTDFSFLAFTVNISRVMSRREGMMRERAIIRKGNIIKHISAGCIFQTIAGADCFMSSVIAAALRRQIFADSAGNGARERGQNLELHLQN